MTRAVTPQPQTALASGATAVGTGSAYTCALTAAGAVQCWGVSAGGRLGTPDTGKPTPTPQTAIASGATALSVGEFHACAVVDGAVQCWGAASQGQLGTSLTFSTSVPQTAVASGATAVTVGSAHSCALTTGGAVLCWGYNLFGQLGSPTNSGVSFAATPTPQVAIASGATAVSAGHDYTCALVSSAVQCWGHNRVGQLGSTANNGTGFAVHVPQTAIPSGATSLSVGGAHACAVVGGAVQCWGYNFRGQLGSALNSGAAYTATPQPQTAIPSGATAVSAGADHTCALVRGAVQCWGLNNIGQLGSEIHNHSVWPTPTPQTAIASGATAVSAGVSHTCAVADGAVLCWGHNDLGQIGSSVNLGTSEATPVPQIVLPAGTVSADDAAVSRGDASLAIRVVGGSVMLTTQLPETVSVSVVNALGQQVAVLYAGAIEPGEAHPLTVPSGLASGVYWVRARGARGAVAAPLLVR